MPPFLSPRPLSLVWTTSATISPRPTRQTRGRPRAGSLRSSRRRGVATVCRAAATSPTPHPSRCAAPFSRPNEPTPHTAPSARRAACWARSALAARLAIGRGSVAAAAAPRRAAAAHANSIAARAG
eukprot:2141041-Prymnesium_polylepis.1